MLFNIGEFICCICLIVAALSPFCSSTASAADNWARKQVTERPVKTKNTNSNVNKNQQPSSRNFSTTPTSRQTLRPSLLRPPVSSSQNKMTAAEHSKARPIYGSTPKQMNQTNFLNRLFHLYDKRIMPSTKGGAVLVEASIFVNSLDSISEITLDYELGVYLRLTWRDPRLAFNKSEFIGGRSVITLDSSVFDSIWSPDLKISNEREASFHKVPTPNRLLQLTNKGDVLYSSRLYLTLSCQMELHSFPFDNQHCPFVLESYSFPINKIQLKWSTQPLEMRDLVVPQFTLSSVRFENDVRLSPLGNFSTLVVTFHIFRDFGFYMLQIYIPSLLTVMTAFTAFWIDPLAVPGRVTVGVFTTLIMANMSFGMRNIVPRVSYIKAVDVWVLVCMLFVFLSLIEYAIVNVLIRQKSYRSVVAEVIRHSTAATLLPSRLTTDVVSAEDEENIRLVDIKEADALSDLFKRARYEGRSTMAVERRLEMMAEQAKLFQARRAEDKGRRCIRRVLCASGLFPKQSFSTLSGFERCEYLETLCRRLFPACFILFNVVYWTLYGYFLQLDYEHANDESDLL